MAQKLPSGEHQNWAKCQLLLPHVEPLFNSKPTTEETLKAWAQVLTNAAQYLWLQGSFDSAQQLAERVLTARENLFGLDDRQTLGSVSNLAQVLEA
jgi:hypothetical protein